MHLQDRFRPVHSIPLFAAIAAFAVLSANRGYGDTIGAMPEVRHFNHPLNISRAHLLVAADDAATYSKVVRLVREHGRGQFIHAFPDSPEMYFLTGRRNPTPANFDFFYPLSDRAMEQLWIDRGINLVVINHLPRFSPAVSSAQLAQHSTPVFQAYGSSSLKCDGGSASAMNAVSRNWAVAAALGLVTGVLVAYVWGGLRQLPVIHDEAAYLLQARIFATGHWTAPGAPLPEFFEQLYVFNTPVVASKYWPAHSLLMVPGIWAGFPGAVPIALWCVSGALVFVIARRMLGVWPAAVVWLLWATGPNALEYRASYFAQSTTVCCWMVALACLDDWVRTGPAGRPSWALSRWASGPAPGP